MSRPSCFAVFRLMASQNLSGNSTGMFAGLTPLRISAIMAAQRRGTALKSAEDQISPQTLTKLGLGDTDGRRYNSARSATAAVATVGCTSSASGLHVSSTSVTV